MTAEVGSWAIEHGRLLGEGGFSRVYAAQSVSGECLITAAKQVFVLPACPPASIEASSREEIERELAALRAVGQHPFIIQLHDHCDLGEHPTSAFCNSSFFFLELATGGELFDRLTDGGRMSEIQLRPYLTCLARALAHCHALGITHGDVKLENALVIAEQPDIVKLADFGLASCAPLLPDGTPESQHLRHGTAGTPGYRAPEMFEHAEAGYRGPPCDIWALGISAFALAAGGFPWDEAQAPDPCFAYTSEGQQSGSGACSLIAAFHSGGRLACPLSDAFQALLPTIFLRQLSTNLRDCPYTCYSCPTASPAPTAPMHPLHPLHAQLLLVLLPLLPLLPLLLLPPISPLVHSTLWSTSHSRSATIRRRFSIRCSPSTRRGE